MTTRKACAGLLPFYLALYDTLMPERLAEFMPFIERVKAGLEANGIDVKTAPVCRVSSEFEAAIKGFEDENVDCLVTLHLAYSPSMESIEAVCGSTLPVCILDTTMDAAFGRDVEPDRLMFNHGVHGVMDFASMCRRRRRHVEIVAGHVTESDVLLRAAERVRAARASRFLQGCRGMRLGSAFDGMGDFCVDEARLAETLGVRIETRERAELDRAVASVTDDEVQAEMDADRERFSCELPEEVHARSNRVGLGLRKLLEDGTYDAFSLNFLEFDSANGPVDTVPFLEASKAMARGVGYAGEGDVLTAALVAALWQGFGRTTFTEIFCPDWRGNSLFLSHMGEINPEVSAVKPRLIEKDYPFSDAMNPAFVTCAPAPGPAVFVDLVPGPDDTFTLLVTPVEVLDDTTNAAMQKSVRGWIRPRLPVADFLEAYSRQGGTHHSALVLGDHVASVEAFARFSGIEAVVLS